MSRKPRLIDAHCHLDLFPDFEEEAARRDRAGVWTLAVTTLPQAWARNRKVASRHSMIEVGLGVHPELVAKYPDAINEWARLAAAARFIGEIGLDGRRRNRHSLAAQVEVFHRIVDVCSQQAGKILTVHSAGAQREVLSLIEDRLDLERNRVVLHWFTGSGPLYARGVKLGCFFSVNLAMLGDSRLVKLLKKLPRERILTETDAPFLDRGGGDASTTLLTQLASVLALPPPEVLELLRRNLDALLRFRQESSP